MHAGKRDSHRLSDGLVNFELFGKAYTFKADADAETAKAVAEFLVKEVEKVEMEMSGAKMNIAKRTILVIAALNLANETIEMKRNHSDLIRNVSERSARLVKTLDAVIPGPGAGGG